MSTQVEAAFREHHQILLDAHAAHLRGEGLTYREIADEMGCSVSVAHDRVMRAYGRMPGPEAAAERQRMLQELDDMAVACYQVMETAHVSITTKGVVSIDVQTPTGIVTVPVPDDHPVLEAVDRLLRIQERRAKLLGTDAPSKRSIEVFTRTMILARINDLEREMA